MRVPITFDELQSGGEVLLNRRRFLSSAAKGTLLGAVASQSLASLTLAADTPPPSSILFFETGVTQWLFVSGAFIWSQAMKMPTSTAITDPYGPGWLLAPMLTPTDYVNAASVTKKAMGDLRNKRGPFIGVFQVPSSAEPSDGWVNLDGSVPFMTWGRTEPNDAKPLHRNILRERAFRDALKQGAQLVVDWYFGAGSAQKTDKLIDFVIGEISRPEDGQKHDDVAALWHERDGTIVTADVHFKSFYPVLLSRRKPVRPPATGPLPSWPMVNGTTPLADGMRVPRRSFLVWRWTGGARLGQVHVVNVRTGATVIDRPQASTSKQDITILRPDKYLFRVRNISRFSDPWLEISFTVV
jgi:hypothetical protein